MTYKVGSLGHSCRSQKRRSPGVNRGPAVTAALAGLVGRNAELGDARLRFPEAAARVAPSSYSPLALISLQIRTADSGGDRWSRTGFAGAPLSARRPRPLLAPARNTTRRRIA